MRIDGRGMGNEEKNGHARKNHELKRIDGTYIRDGPWADNDLFFESIS